MYLSTLNDDFDNALISDSLIDQLRAAPDRWSMSSKITIIAFNIIFHQYNYHQMLKIRQKIIKKITFILAEHQNSFDKIDIFSNFSQVRNFNPVLLNFVYFI